MFKELIDRKGTIAETPAAEQNNASKSTKSDDASLKKQVTNTDSSDAIEELAEKLDNLAPIEKSQDYISKVRSQEYTSKINYFEKKSIEVKSSKKPEKNIKIDMERYKQVKEKILNKKSQNEARVTQMMSIEECVKLLKEYEKKVQVGVYICY